MTHHHKTTFTEVPSGDWLPAVNLPGEPVDHPPVPWEGSVVEGILSYKKNFIMHQKILQPTLRESGIKVERLLTGVRAVMYR